MAAITSQVSSEIKSQWKIYLPIFIVALVLTILSTQNIDSQNFNGVGSLGSYCLLGCGLASFIFGLILLCYRSQNKKKPNEIFDLTQEQANSAGIEALIRQDRILVYRIDGVPFVKFFEGGEVCTSVDPTDIATVSSHLDNPQYQKHIITHADLIIALNGL